MGRFGIYGLIGRHIIAPIGHGMAWHSVGVGYILLLAVGWIDVANTPDLSLVQCAIRIAQPSKYVKQQYRVLHN